MPVKGILFDLDGVIVDTLHYHFLAWQEMFKRKDGEVKELTVLIHEGRSSKEILPILIKESGIQIPEEKWNDFIEEKRKYYRSIVKVIFYPDALDTVRKLRKLGIKCALVTACAKKNMEKALTSEQRALFNIIVTGDDIPRAKPNPDPYEIAQTQLGYKKEECLVVENAPLGIQSAKAAGIRCAVIATTLPMEYLKGADFYLKKLPDIFKYISLFQNHSEGLQPF
ncbi:MAG: HAD family phosphatase [Candidatus Cloacimonetes bacterium]|nr:HAD family phosphatase [Candidatus Cloacimonadota bacterium]